LFNASIQKRLKMSSKQGKKQPKMGGASGIIIGKLGMFFIS